MPDAWALTTVLVKAVLCLCAFTSSGLVLARVVFWDETDDVWRKMRNACAVFAFVGCLAAILSFALRGAALTGDASGMTDPEMLGLMWQTPVGTAAMLRLIGFGLLLAGLVLGRVGWIVSAVGGGLVIWSFAIIGHVSGDVGYWLKPILFVHLVAVAFWIGILLPLQLLTQSTDTVAAAGRLGDRFGQIASLVIPGLLIAGVALGWVLLGSLSAVFTTEYGRMLLIKLLLVAVLLGLGALNKLRIVPGLIDGDPQASSHLSKALRLEWAVFAAVFLATAALTSLYALPTLA